MIYDVLIIGGGITGCSIGFELSKYDLKVKMVEKHNDISMMTTKANSGIVHAGYDPRPGTKMARLNVLGSKLYKSLAKELNVHYVNNGSLVIGRNDQDKEVINELYKRGKANGVEGLEILTTEEIRKKEPSINEDVNYALFAPTAAIVSPWEMALALGENAVRNGMELSLETEVLDINKVDDKFVVKTSKGDIEARYVINAAGLYADRINDLAIKDHREEHFDITPVKGEYYLLDKVEGRLANTVIFQTPNELGKGVLVSKTVHGNLIVGPNASSEVESKDDVSTTSKALSYVRTASSLSVPSINFRNNIRNFSGERATIVGRDDFLIEESKVVPHFINFAGIKSPGLSCGPAFGLEAVEMLKKSGLEFKENKNFKITPLPKFFKDMTKDEINHKVETNELYGRIICRCETVSEGEIVDALHRPIVCPTIDGVKRRTNAGMGRCQGGFCGPKVLEIIKRETGLKAMDILQDKAGSNIVLNHTKGGDENE